MQGTVFSHYEILGEIGRGGMGVVYKAQDTRLWRFVALKFLTEEFVNDPQALDRFRREAQAASALSHPNICTIYDVGEEGGRTFIAMEYLQGATVKQLIAWRGALPLDQLVAVAIQTAEVLEAAHEAGILHRDIKPANIFVTESGRVKILDFGLAKVGFRRMAATGTDGADIDMSGGWALGTMAYMSPEQALGKPLDERSDLFSLGTVIYEMTTGKVPFQGDTTGTLFLSLVQEAPILPRKLNAAVPERLQAIIQRSLEKDREKRYQRASELLADLQELQSESVGEGAIPQGARALSPHISVPITTPNAESIVTPTAEARPRRQAGLRLWLWAAGGISLALLLVLTGKEYLQSPKVPGLKSQDKVVIADVANTTSEPLFDGALRQGLTIALRQSPFLNVLTERDIAATLQQMEKPAGTRLSREIAREVCLRSNSQALITGSISPAGDGYELKFQALGCEKENALAEIDTQVANRDAVISGLGDAGAQLRRKLGESLASLQQYDKPLPEATTSSLEALQAYAAGRDPGLGLAESIPPFERAIKLDPNFAMAYANLGSSYANLGRWEQATQYRIKAYELRNRVTERERLQIEVSYYRDVTGDTEKAVKTCEEGLKAFPDNYVLHTLLAFSYMDSGDFENAVRQLEAVRPLTPDRVGLYVNLMAAYDALGRVDEAKQAYEEARRRNLDELGLRANRYMVAFHEGDEAGMREQVDAAKGRPGYEDELLALEAETEAFYGHFAKSRELTKLAEASAERALGKERGLKYAALEAWAEAEVGSLAATRRWSAVATTIPGDRILQADTAVALAAAGNPREAEALLNQLKQKYPQNLSVQSYIAPTVLARIELQKGEPGKAIERLRPSLNYELAGTDLNTMALTYARGLAYLQLHDGTNAAAEFQKMLDHPALVGNFVYGALVHLQLGRAYAMSGKMEEARTQYQDFLALWKDADPDIPVLKRAKAEYAKLNRV